MALMESEQIAMGTSAPEFKLKGVDDAFYSLEDFADAEVLVVMFICNHCPYVKPIMDELVSLAGKFGEKVQFVGINPNIHPNYPDDSFENMKIVAKEKGFNFPYLVDETQDIAKAYGAKCTPDLYVYDKSRGLAYHGRLDELGEAVEALLNGGRPGEQQKYSMGCSIKWRDA